MSLFKIRRVGTKSFSKGLVQRGWDKKFHVDFSEKSHKTWTDEKLVQKHIEKAVVNGIDVSNWEVVEVTYTPTKPINDWISPKVTIAILKK